MQMRSRHTE
ncbi:hypothetical protein N7455_006889 [Penicillium solitum]|nr:hypothetical protein N7455_006889 [Penicillium solitum]